MFSQTGVHVHELKSHGGPTFNISGRYTFSLRDHSHVRVERREKENI